MLHRRTGDGQGAVMQAVDAAQLDLAHAKGFGQLVDELLLGRCCSGVIAEVDL